MLKGSTVMTDFNCRLIARYKRKLLSKIMLRQIFLSHGCVVSRANCGQCTSYLGRASWSRCRVGDFEGILRFEDNRERDVMEAQPGLKFSRNSRIVQ
jgi:hypothetical protein